MIRFVLLKLSFVLPGLAVATVTLSSPSEEWFRKEKISRCPFRSHSQRTIRNEEGAFHHFSELHSQIFLSDYVISRSAQVISHARTCLPTYLLIRHKICRDRFSVVISRGDVVYTVSRPRGSLIYRLSESLEDETRYRCRSFSISTADVTIFVARPTRRERAIARGRALFALVTFPLWEMPSVCWGFVSVSFRFLRQQRRRPLCDPRDHRIRTTVSLSLFFLSWISR